MKQIVPLIDKGPSDNPRFQYTIATAYYYGKEYEKSISYGLTSAAQYSCYDTELLLSDLFLKTHDYQQCFDHASLAHRMCPNRLMPLYILFNLSSELSDFDRLKLIGDEILHKEIKVNSEDTRLIRYDVRKRMYEILYDY